MEQRVINIYYKKELKAERQPLVKGFKAKINIYIKTT